MKHILVCFDHTSYEDSPFDEENFRQAYHELAAAVAARGHMLHLVRHAVSYEGDMRFSSGWTWNGTTFESQTSPFEGDLILNKGLGFEPRGNVNMINPPEMAAFCQNKFDVVRRFPESSPRTELVTAKENIRAACVKIGSSTIVAKPLEGSGGEGITIGTPEEIEKAIESFPYLLQEFIDTSAGIPGILTARHDYRTIIMGGRIVLTFIRAPRKGSLLSNTSQGGFMILVPPALRPPETLTFASEIDKEFADIPRRLYSIDCARNERGEWKLIELNDQPGLMNRFECGDLADDYFNAFADLLVS